jgi:hypothetical protein
VQLEINAEGVGAVGSRVLQLVTVLTLVTTAGTIDGSRWGGSPDRVLLTLTHRPLPIQVVIERSPQLARRTAYARGICEGIAVRAGELSLCMGRICVAGAGRAYALALLAICALGESVKLSDRTDHGRENGPQHKDGIRSTPPRLNRPHHGNGSRGENTYAHFLRTKPPAQKRNLWLPTYPLLRCPPESGVNSSEDTQTHRAGRKPPPGDE